MSRRSLAGFVRLAILTASLAVTLVALPGSSAATAAPGGCQWRPAYLPLPSGFTEGLVESTDGGTRFAGSAVNSTASDPGLPDPSGAVVWEAGRLRVLPVPEGYFSVGEGVNRRGDVVGYLIPPEGWPIRPVLWRDNQLIELATLGGEAAARDINDAGVIVGEAQVPGFEAVPVAWSADAPDQIQQIPSPRSQDFPSAVTDEGVLIGNVSVDDGAGMLVGRAAAGTVESGLHPLANPTAQTSSAVWGAAGEFIAGSETSLDMFTTHAVVWQNEQPRVLSSQDSVAFGVNSAGIVVGSTDRPVVWINGTERALRPPPGARSGSARVITENNDVAGVVDLSAGGGQPATWRCR
jgi:uncharacterized membrane protein